MPMGPGKYDDLATYCREQAKARGVLLIVIGGEKGEGFACQTDLLVLAALPKMLRHIADELEGSVPTT